MPKRRGYFKHLNDAYDGSTLSQLMDNKQYEAGNLWWILLERANQKNSDNITEPYSYFCRRLNVKRPKLERVLTELRSCCENFSFEFQKKNVRIFIPNYAEYQETRGQKTSKNAAKKAPIKDYRLKIKDKNTKKDWKADEQFCKMWEEWPTREGGNGSPTQAFNNFLARCKEHGRELMVQCARNYLRHCKAKDVTMPYKLSNFYSKQKMYFEEFAEAPKVKCETDDWSPEMKKRIEEELR